MTTTPHPFEFSLRNHNKNKFLQAWTRDSPREFIQNTLISQWVIKVNLSLQKRLESESRRMRMVACILCRVIRRNILTAKLTLHSKIQIIWATKVPSGLGTPLSKFKSSLTRGRGGPGSFLRLVELRIRLVLWGGSALSNPCPKILKWITMEAKNWPMAVASSWACRQRTRAVLLKSSQAAYLDLTFLQLWRAEIWMPWKDRG